MIDTRSKEVLRPQPKTGDLKTSTLGQSLVDHARDELGNLQEDSLAKAIVLGQQVKSAAVDVQDAAASVVESVKGFASQAGDNIESAVAEQKAAGAERMSGLAAAVRRAAEEIGREVPAVAPYIMVAADEIDEFADALRTRNVAEIIDAVDDFARRQPVAFFGAAALAGFAIVRLFKVPVNRTPSRSASRK